jgi:GAF domain-containing protein
MHDTDLGNIQLLDPQTGKLVIAAQRGFGLGFLDHFSTVGLEDDSACGRAMRDRGSVFIPDVTTDPLFASHRSVAQAAGFRAVKSTPLINQDGALFGVLSTHFRSIRQMPAMEIHWLDQRIQRQVISLGLPTMWTPEHSTATKCAFLEV